MGASRQDRNQGGIRQCGGPMLALLHDGAVEAELISDGGAGLRLVRVLRPATQFRKHSSMGNRRETAWVATGRLLRPCVVELLSLALWPHNMLPPDSTLLGEDDPWRSAEGIEEIADWLSESSDPWISRTHRVAGEPPKAPEAEVHAALGVREDDACGRSLFAKSAHIEAGELLLREAAHAIVLNAEMAFSRCAHCSAVYNTHAPCACGGWMCLEAYCSPACRSSAWSAWHASECGGPRWCRMAPDGARLVVRSMLRCCGHGAHRGCSAEAPGSFGAQRASSNSLRLLGLRGIRMPSARASLLRLHAHLAWRCMGDPLRARGWSKDSVEELMTTAQTNLHAITASLSGVFRAQHSGSLISATPTGIDELLGADVVGSTCNQSGEMGRMSGDHRAEGAIQQWHVRTIALGLFLHASLANHSCEPNTNVLFSHSSFPSSKSVVSEARLALFLERHVPQAPGATIAPAPPEHLGSACYATLELRSATALAKGADAFTCYGPQAGHMRLRERRAALHSQYGFLCGCNACKKEAAGLNMRDIGYPQGQSVELGLRVGERGHGGSRKVTDSHASVCGAVDDAVDSLRRAAILDDEARRACEDEGDFVAAASAVRRALHLLRRVFPPGSTQLAHEHAKLAQLSFNADEPHAERELCDAAQAMARCYGENHPEVVELRRLAQLAQLARASSRLS